MSLMDLHPINNPFNTHIFSISRFLSSKNHRGSCKEIQNQEKIQEVPIAAIDCLQIEVLRADTNHHRRSGSARRINGNGWILLCPLHSGH